jgi:hypothetical protein
MDWRRLLKRPDIGKPQHRIAAMSKYNSFQEMEFFLEEAFEGGFDQMAAIRRKMSLNMRNLNRRSHQAKRMPTCSIDELLRHIRAEKTNGHAVLGKKGDDFFISPGGD